ncbi:MAG: hypothetical protein AB7I27_04430 [Bacteriovoracaceae bacterium]
MMKIVLITFFVSFQAFAYVPTVESLFRNGSNPDINVNGAAVTFSLKRINPQEGQKAEEFYKVFLSKAGGDSVKVAQARYNNNTFSESALDHKIYYSNMNPYTLKGSNEDVEKSLFYSLMHSMVFNNGSHIVNYLKSIGVPVKLNNDLINRDKVELLAAYKHYLAATNKDRTAKIPNPLRPEDAGEKEKVDRVMSEGMYIDTNQVKLSREGGEAAWLVTALPFEAMVSYKDRDVHVLKYKSTQGEFELLAKTFWLANGTHRLPRFMTIKTFKGETFELEITNLRHYQEKEEDIVRRLKNWDQILKGHQSKEPRPDFLL